MPEHFASRFQQICRMVPPLSIQGRVVDICGPVVRATLGGIGVGDVVEIEQRNSPRQAQNEQHREALSRPFGARAQVISCERNTVALSSLDSTEGIFPGALVRFVSHAPQISLGSYLLGSVVDGLGGVLARLTAAKTERLSGNSLMSSIQQTPPHPLNRQIFHRIFTTGIRSFDTFVTLGEGQRMGVFAEPGVGKSSLISAIAQSSTADVNVLALVGERGREVAEMVQRMRENGKAQNLVLVCSTSDEPPLRRISAALTATRIAEYFRDQGCRVLLQIDSLTRLFRAYREVGLAAGETPVRRGYTPSVFSQLPALIERAGTNEKGSITALYTVLLSSELEEDPMVEELKGLTDGHLILRRSLAEAGHFPAIDVINSLSRFASSLLSPERSALVMKARRLLARHSAERDLLALGGEIDQELSHAIRLSQAIEPFLRQNSSEGSALEKTFHEFETLMRVVGVK